MMNGNGTDDRRRAVLPDERAKLRRAEKLATVGILAGGVAHDVNNLLTTILGRSELIRSELGANSEARLHLECLLQAAERARDLTRQILTFSGQVEEERRSVQLQLVVWEALELLRSTLPTSIEVHENIDFKCGPVFADPTQMHQVFMNLATNAYHAMYVTGGVLEVSLDTVGVDASHMQLGTKVYDETFVRLTVSDTGHGMGRATIDRIFEPFYTTKEIGAGTGLGLSVVQSIIETHGGEITVYSELGKGTTFQVYLPTMGAGIETMGDKGSAGGDERILIIDDDQVSARIQQQMLERLGYKVTVSTDSRRAVKAFLANPNGFDAVVAQRSAPGLGHLQNDVASPHPQVSVPVVLTRGYIKGAYQSADGEPELADCVMRPIVARQLDSAIRRVLDRLPPSEE